MKTALLVFCFFIPRAFALEAVVTVLETPLLEQKSLAARVVQYLRKGDVIKLHPALVKSSRYDHLAPGEKSKRVAEWQDDPLFPNASLTGDLDDELIPTLDRQGKTVYVIRDHLQIYFNDPQEFGQRVLRKDPTDYRLEEPLPKNYPFFSPTGYRAQLTGGISQPYFESYPYPSSIKSKGYSSPVDLNLQVLKRVPHDQQDRFFFGLNAHFRTFSNSYSLDIGRRADEFGQRFGVGPAISYDVFKAVKDRINLYGLFNVYLFNQISVKQKDSVTTDQRNYRALNVSPRIGAQYHRKQVFENIDLVIGTSLEFDPPATFKAKSAPTESSWWPASGGDKFKTRTTFTLSGYLGFQVAY